MVSKAKRGRAEPLAAFPPGAEGTVVGVDARGETRRQLYAMGILEGARLRVVRRTTLGGTVLVAVGTSQYALGNDVASLIRVRAR